MNCNENTISDITNDFLFVVYVIIILQRNFEDQRSIICSVRQYFFEILYLLERSSYTIGRWLCLFEFGFKADHRKDTLVVCKMKSCANRRKDIRVISLWVLEWLAEYFYLILLICTQNWTYVLESRLLIMSAAFCFNNHALLFFLFITFSYEKVWEQFCLILFGFFSVVVPHPTKNEQEIQFSHQIVFFIENICSLSGIEKLRFFKWFPFRFFFNFNKAIVTPL